MNWFLLPLSPHPHVILHEGFTRSCRIHCSKKAKENLLPRGRRCPKGGWGGGRKRHFRDTPWSFPKPFQFYEARHDSRTVKPGCLDFWLIHGLSFCAEAVLIVPFVAGYFNELVSSSTLTPPPCHSARRVYPELQNPLLPKAKQNLLPEREGARRADEGEIGNQPETPSLLLNLNIHFIGKSWSLSQ